MELKVCHHVGAHHGHHSKSLLFPADGFKIKTEPNTKISSNPDKCHPNSIEAVMYSVCLVFGCINIIYCRIFGVQRGSVVESTPSKIAKRGLLFSSFQFPKCSRGSTTARTIRSERKYHTHQNVRTNEPRTPCTRKGLKINQNN